MPVYNADGKHLRAAVDSLRAQVYDRWELCIANDASTSPACRALLRILDADPRIHVVWRDANGHIAAATESAVAVARGTWLAFMDQDDILPPLALTLVAQKIRAEPRALLIYTDEDKFEDSRGHFEPHRKPDWNSDLLHSQNYLNHLTVMRSDLFARAGGLRAGFDGSQDYDLLLRATRLCAEGQIQHVPYICYHWRASATSVAAGGAAKSYAEDAALRALSDDLTPNWTPRATSAERFLGYDMDYVGPPIERTVHHVRLSDTGSVLALLKPEWGDDEAVLLLGAGVEPDSDKDLEVMLAQLCRESVGAVGGRLLDVGGRVAGSALWLGPRLASGPSLAIPAWAGMSRDDFSFQRRAALTQTVSALSFEFTITSIGALRDILGQPNLGAGAHEDIVFSLGLAARGQRCVWLPHVLASGGNVRTRPMDTAAVRLLMRDTRARRDKNFPSGARRGLLDHHPRLLADRFGKWSSLRQARLMRRVAQ